jgi:hypothetical protein
MNTLAGAWQWYQNARQQITLFQRLTRRYWPLLPWDGSLDRDDELKAVDPARVSADADAGLDYLDDLAVVVLFSVFESMVRGAALEAFREQTAAAGHPVVQAVMADARGGIEGGSFYRVLSAYRGVVGPDLIEQVNQVRKYRNWVAHGRRDTDRRTENVTPLAAYNRLQEFAVALGLFSRGGFAGLPVLGTRLPPAARPWGGASAPVRAMTSVTRAAVRPSCESGLAKAFDATLNTLIDAHVTDRAAFLAARAGVPAGSAFATLNAWQPGAFGPQ